MHLTTRLDCDLLAVEQADELTLLVELTAPAVQNAEARAPATLQVVLDRSGSMAGDRLDGARRALLGLVDRLDPTDNLGVVAFDDEVQVVVPAGPLRDKMAAKRAVAAVYPGGSTDLSAGYLRGLQEARRVAGPAGSTVLLVSDGHANAGVTDPRQLGKVAAEARTHSVTTSTLGFGLGYDERLLSALARGGAGNELFAEEADTAGALIAGEVTGLLSQVAQAASLLVRWTPQVSALLLLNELPATPVEGGVMVELGSFYAGETRRLVLRLQVPGISALGLAQVATLDLTYVSLPDLVQHTTSMPVHVNVVPGDQAAGRIPDPEIRSEALFQQTQRDKRRAGELLSRGQVDEAVELLSRTGRSIDEALPGMPVAFSGELASESRLLADMAEEAQYDSSRAAKAASYDANRKGRMRGRRSSGGALQLRWLLGQDAPEAMAVIEEWELQRLRRLAPAAAGLRPSIGAPEAAQVAAELAHALPEGHPLREFFAGASACGGFTVERT